MRVLMVRDSAPAGRAAYITVLHSTTDGGRGMSKYASPPYPEPVSRQEALDGLAPYRRQAAAQFAAFIAAHPDGIYTATEARQRDELYWWLKNFDAAEREAGRDDP
jgi:hypothetical protein